MRLRRLVRFEALMLMWLGAGGCVLTFDGRTPNLIATQPMPAITVAPRMHVILSHRHIIDGSDAATPVTDASREVMERSFDRVQADILFLGAAHRQLSDPEFVLRFDTEIVEHDADKFRMAAATFFVLPVQSSSDIVVRATLMDRDGQVLGEGHATGAVRSTMHPSILPFLPIWVWFMPGDELYDDTYRDALIPVAQSLAAQLATRR